jgi:hypothetical protein
MIITGFVGGPNGVELVLHPLPQETTIQANRTWMEADNTHTYNQNKSILSTRTRCENCAHTLIWYDGMTNAHQGWWHFVREYPTGTTWRAHTPEQCQEMRRADGK